VPGPSRAFWTLAGRSGVSAVDNALLCTCFFQTAKDIDKGAELPAELEIRAGRLLRLLLCLANMTISRVRILGSTRSLGHENISPVSGTVAGLQLLVELGSVPLSPHASVQPSKGHHQRPLQYPACRKKSG
jgi:hypothetical protein